MVNKGGCKVGKKAPEGTPKGGCKEGLKAPKKKKLVVVGPVDTMVATKKTKVQQPAQKAKVIAAKPRVAKVAKVVTMPKKKRKLVVKKKAEPKPSIGKKLTGLSKEEMNKLSPLELFGMLPVSVSKIVLKPSVTGVKVAKSAVTTQDVIDLILNRKGKKYMFGKNWLQEWATEPTQEKFNKAYPHGRKKEFGNFYKELKSWVMVTTDDKLALGRNTPYFPSEMLRVINKVVKFANKDHDNARAAEIGKDLREGILKYGSAETLKEVAGQKKELLGKRAAERDKDSIENSLEIMKDHDDIMGMKFSINNVSWYGDGPGQGGGFKDELWQVTKINGTTGKVTLKFLYHRGSSHYHDTEPPKQKTKTIYLSRIWNKRA